MPPRKKKEVKSPLSYKDMVKNLDKGLADASDDERSYGSDDLIKIEHKFDKQRLAIMKQQGVDGYAFEALSSKFVLEDAIVRITPDHPQYGNNERIKPISTNKQIRWASKLIANPLRGSYTAAISSYPSDSHAKVLALNIMNRAITLQSSGKVAGHAAYPYWHNLYGGFNDSLREAQEPKPYSMLIISNVGPDSTPVKLEKLRDLLIKYASRPKIVIVNGMDPASFFLHHVRLPLRYIIHMSAIKKTDVLSGL